MHFWAYSRRDKIIDLDMVVERFLNKGVGVNTILKGLFIRLNTRSFYSSEKSIFFIDFLNFFNF